MFKETLSPQAFQLLKRICQDDTFQNFHLVGGTALALQLGHRKSKDVDFFSPVGFEANLVEKFKKWGGRRPCSYSKEENLQNFRHIIKHSSTGGGSGARGEGGGCGSKNGTV